MVTNPASSYFPLKLHYYFPFGPSLKELEALHHPAGAIVVDLRALANLGTLICGEWNILFMFICLFAGRSAEGQV